MTTDVTYSRNDLEALSLTDLRKAFTSATGLPCGTRRPETMIAAILDAQAENNPDDDDQVSGPTEEGTVPEPDDHQEPEPTKVNVVGTGSNKGSSLLCELVSHRGTVAVVQVLGSEVRFRVSTGESVRTRKSWQTAGWMLDVTTLPEMKEPTMEQLMEAKSADLSLAQLRDLYQFLSGRSTSSNSRTYLTQRVRLAREGRLPAGTRRARGGEPVRVVPVGMPVPTEEALDAAWRRLGYASRISFIRSALSEKLQAEGEDAVAEMVERQHR